MSRIPKVILLIESSRASGRAMLCGIANYAHHHGPWSFFWEPGDLEMGWTKLRAVEADGIILRDTEKVEEVLECGLPAVVVGHRQTEIQGLVNVVTDSPAVGRFGAEHLLACGFKHFAFCGYARTQIENTAWSEIRRDHFSTRIQEAGFNRPPYFELSLGAKDWSKDRRALAEWLKSLPKPVGLMACNDDCSQRVMEACKEADLSVPDKVGVIGADNDEVICGLTNPPMSSVEINFERAGYEAAYALDGLMRHSNAVPRRITAVATQVVSRRSTDFVAAEDSHLAKALQFIRDHARRGVSVDEVAQVSGLSRRALERRFRKLMGRSILGEIRRVRTDQIARLLSETDLPVAQIADLLGFEDVQHIARYFRSDKKVSPMAYRKAHSRKNLKY
jgi:LacI family transcriptional regulator